MNKYVVVTGAGSGIGYEISRELLKLGFTPLLIGRDLKKLEKASKELEDSPFFSCDLTQKDSSKKLTEFYKSLEAGELFGLVNNAGAIKYSSFEDSSSEHWLYHFNINLMSAINCSKAFLEPLKETKGAIVNISSTLGIKPIENTSSYSASKAAMNNLTQSMALELAKYDIKVNAICPGIVNTPIHSESQSKSEDWHAMLKDAQPLGRVGEPKDIAGLVCFLLSKQASWITGSLIPVDGGILLKG
jgi:NAD(P)-dependent dehydrogenase (short-subunit alcohol dehydrogenase family)